MTLRYTPGIYTMSLSFDALCSRGTLGVKRGRYNKILAFDPGETTGTVLLNVENPKQVSLTHAEQLDTSRLSAKTFSILHKCIEVADPEFIVIEDYRVFSWKRDQHVWSALHTPKLIGMLISLACLYHIPYGFQTPQVAKGFCTDKRLRDWGFYIPGHRHANDAIRHAVCYALFGATLKIENLNGD